MKEAGTVPVTAFGAGMERALTSMGAGLYGNFEKSIGLDLLHKALGGKSPADTFKYAKEWVEKNRSAPVESAIVDLLAEGRTGAALYTKGMETAGGLVVELGAMRKVLGLFGKLRTLPKGVPTLKEMTKAKALSALTAGAWVFAKTEGSVGERAKAGMAASLLMGTNIGSQLAPTNVTAILLDMGLNVVASNMMGQYKAAVQAGVQKAIDAGQPDKAMQYALVEIFPVVGMDVGFALFAKSARVEKMAREKQIAFEQAAKMPEAEAAREPEVSKVEPEASRPPSTPEEVFGVAKPEDVTQRPVPTPTQDVTQPTPEVTPEVTREAPAEALKAVPEAPGRAIPPTPAMETPPRATGAPGGLQRATGTAAPSGTRLPTPEDVAIVRNAIAEPTAPNLRELAWLVMDESKPDSVRRVAKAVKIQLLRQVQGFEPLSTQKLGDVVGLPELEAAVGTMPVAKEPVKALAPTPEPVGQVTPKVGPQAATGKAGAVYNPLVHGVGQAVEDVKGFGREQTGVWGGIVKAFTRVKQTLKTPEGQEVSRKQLLADERSSGFIGQAKELFRQAGIDIDRLSRKDAELLGQRMMEGQDPAAKAIMDRIWGFLKDSGMDIGKVENYLPRILKSDVATAMIDGAQRVKNELLARAEQARASGKPMTSEQSDRAVLEILARPRNRTILEAINALIQSGQVKTMTQARQIIEQYARTELFGETPHEKHRTLELPSHFYETNAAIVLNKYLSRMSKRYGEISVWGSDPGEAILKELDTVRQKDPAEAQRLFTMLSQWDGSYDRKAWKEIDRDWGTWVRKTHEYFFGYEYATKIGGGTSVINQLFQPLISSVRYGPWNFAKGVWSVLSDPQVRAQIRQSGSLELATLTRGAEPEQGLMQRFTKVWPVTSAFRMLNRANAYTAAAAMREAIQKWHQDANSTPLTSLGKSNKQYATWKLNEWGLSKDQPLSAQRERIQEVLYRFATDSQAQRNVQNDAWWANTPTGRVFWLFKRFGYRQFTWMKDELSKDFNYTMETGDMLPSVRVVLTMGLAGTLGGEAYLWAKNKIKELMTGKPQIRTDDNTTIRVINDIAAVGAFGLAGDMARDLERGGVGRNVQSIATPVIASDIERLYNAVATGVTTSRKYSPVVGEGEAVKMGVKAAAQEGIGMLGSIPAWGSQRFETQAKSEGRVRKAKERARKEVFEATTSGDTEKVQKVIDDFMAQYPGEPLWEGMDTGKRSFIQAYLQWRKEQTKQAEKHK